MKKKLTIIIAGIMISISASSQTTRENIDKAKNDKDAKERSAKADVIIHKKIISDSTTRIAPVKTVAKTPANKVKHKKHKHKVKFKKASK